MSSGLIGALFAFATAISSSAASLQISHLKSVSPAFLTFLKFCLGFVCALLLLAVGYFGDWNVTSFLFFGLVVLAIPLEYLIAYFQTKAYQVSPQSLVGPLWGTSAIFALPFAALVLGEIPSLWGLIGVFLVIIGTFVLGWRAGLGNVFDSLRHVFKEKGAYYMLAAALCGALATIIAKYAFTYASPALYLLFISGLTAIIGIRAGLKQASIASAKGKGVRITFLTLTQGVLLITHFIGLSLLPAAYFLSIKRSSVVFDVVAGKIFSKDENFGPRLLGALFIFAGILLTLLRG